MLRMMMMMLLLLMMMMMMMMALAAAPSGPRDALVTCLPTLVTEPDVAMLVTHLRGRSIGLP